MDGLMLSIFLCFAIGMTKASGWKSPLVLTSYIQQGKFDEARRMAWSPPLEGDLESYSGMFEVNNQTGKKMFFWFFPSQEDPKRDPFLIWIDGLPFSSLHGVFHLNGPYTFDGRIIGKRRTSWQKYHNVIYIDNPLGVGFSQPDSQEFLQAAASDTGKNLFSTIFQFFKLFPVYRENDLYLTGSSYGAKSLALLAKEMSDSKVSFNLKGMFLQNPVIDPQVQMSHVEFLYQWGIISKQDQRAFAEREKHIQEALTSQDASAVFKQYNNYIISMTGEDTLLTNISGPIDPLQYMYEAKEPHYIKLLSKPWVRNSLHVGNTPFENDIFTNPPLIEALMPIFSLSVKQIFEELLGHIRITLFVGQSEMLATYPNVAELATAFEWPGKKTYIQTRRKPIFVEDVLVGYEKSFSNLSLIMLRNAGHHVIADQPEVTLLLLRKFTKTITPKY